jgi:hypothetical protein
MSHSAPEILTHREAQYVFFSDSPLFVPATLGLRPTGFTTACWSGWHPTYEVNQGRLYLRDLTIQTAIENLPVICRVPPKQSYQGCCYYERLFLPLGLTGEISLTAHYPGRWGIAAVPDADRIPSFRLTFDLGQLIAVQNETFIRKTDPALEWPECVIRIPVAQDESTPFDDEVAALPESAIQTEP